MHPKPRPKLIDKRKAAAAKQTAYQKARALVKQRDKGLCRICGGKGYDTHHIVMRSKGGKDTAENLIMVCRECHQGLHGHTLKLSEGLIVGEWIGGLVNDYEWRRI